MDSKSLIRKDKRGYSIVFQNYRGLIESQIEEIFSKYGRVTSITVTGDERGYRFVRFATREEAQRAVENAKSENIKLRAHKLRQSGSSSQQDDENKIDVRETKRQIPVWQHEVDSASVYSSSEISSDDQSSCFQRSFHPRSTSMKCLRGSVFDGCDERAEEPMPKLVANNIRPVVANRNIVRNAAEVVVGNVHPNFGAGYLLHLFDKYEPIAISHMQVVPNTERRYCHVYFRNGLDAEEVEKIFDRHDLMGKKLVVMRPNRLMMASVINAQRR